MKTYNRMPRPGSPIFLHFSRFNFSVSFVRQICSASVKKLHQHRNVKTYNTQLVLWTTFFLRSISNLDFFMTFSQIRKWLHDVNIQVISRQIVSQQLNVSQGSVRKRDVRKTKKNQMTTGQTSSVDGFRVAEAPISFSNRKENPTIMKKTCSLRWQMTMERPIC